MRTLVCLALLASPAAWSAASAAPAPSSGIPAGVKYTPASAEITEKARARLAPALTDATALAALLGPDDDVYVKVGPFLGIEIETDGLKGRKAFGEGRYRIPESADMPETIANSFGAQHGPQKVLLAHYITLIADFSGPVTLREPTFDELALVWYWIAWDLEGPLLVAETAHEKYFFDFDATTGHITWIERLTHPCFTASQEGKEILSCTCMGVERQDLQWRIGFQIQASCPAPGLHDVRLASGVTALAKKPASGLPAAYVRVGDKSRVDSMVTRRFTDAFAINVIEEKTRGYKGPGKLLEGTPPVAPKDDKGDPIHGYVLLGSAIGADGRMTVNRILLSTDDRLSAAVLEFARTWRVEPATLDGKPVTEIVWQELSL